MLPPNVSRTLIIRRKGKDIESERESAGNGQRNKKDIKRTRVGDGYYTPAPVGIGASAAARVFGGFGIVAGRTF